MSNTRLRRLKEAQESLREAKLIRESGVSNLATLTKLYHAMIYTLMAMFEIEDIGRLTHADLIERFDKEYVQKGLMSKDYLDALIRAYNFTHECDCAHMKEPETADIDCIMPIAEEFVKKLSEMAGD